MEHIDAQKAIRAAIKTGDSAMALSIIRSNPDYLHIVTPFGTWLHVAASHGNLELVRSLISMGAEINRRSGVFDAFPIKEAASEGHCLVVEYLIGEGAELDVSEPERNPLFAAIYGGHVDIVRLLLASGIDHSIKYSGKSMKAMDALAFAIERGQQEIARLLKTWGQPNA